MSLLASAEPCNNCRDRRIVLYGSPRRRRVRAPARCCSLAQLPLPFARPTGVWRGGRPRSCNFHIRYRASAQCSRIQIHGAVLHVRFRPGREEDDIAGGVGRHVANLGPNIDTRRVLRQCGAHALTVAECAVGPDGNNPTSYHRCRDIPRTRKQSTRRICAMEALD